MEFEVGGKIFAAHKSVLAARSAVFKEEFFGPTKEKDTSYVRISDMHPESFEALLHFMYTDSLPEMTMNSLKDGAVTTGKPTYVECPDICRVHNLEHSAKLLFAECQTTCTRRTTGTRQNITRQRHTLPSAG